MISGITRSNQTVNGSVQYERNVDGPSGSVRFAYDANGNRTEKWTNGLFAARYFYDHDNQLQGISFNNDSDYTDPGDYEYVYDPSGRRIKAVEDGATRYFVYDGLDCVAELDANKNLTKYYVRGLGLGGGIGDIIAEWRPSMTNWYSYNHRGDVTPLTANGGRVTNRLEYTAFGSLSTINYQLSTRSIGFSSKEYDAKSGLSYYGFRYYDAASGRWMTTEPSGYDGPNLYAMCWNNVVEVTDVYGLWGAQAHDRLLSSAFRKTISDSQLTRMQRIDRDFDRGNQDINYVHCMSDANEGLKSAKRKINEWIAMQIKKARELALAGDCQGGVGELEKGLHTIMDCTAPPHVTSHGEPKPMTGILSLKGHGGDNMPFSDETSGDITPEIERKTTARLRNAWWKAFHGTCCR